VISGICVLQENRSFDVQCFRDNGRMIRWDSSEFGKGSKRFFVALLEEKPARCVRVEDHSNAEDESG
jgi:hypothetical protein